jgi:hypothetical protein
MLGLGNSLASTNYSGEFSPLDIGAPLKLWLKYNTSITAEEWKDASGNSMSAVQLNSGNQAEPHGGGLEFDGTNDYYDFPLPSFGADANHSFMMFAVIEVDDLSPPIAILGGANQFIDINSTSTVRLLTTSPAVIWTAASGTPFLQGQKYILAVEREVAGTINVYVNGVLLTPISPIATTAQIKFKTLGRRDTAADRYFDGHIYELLFYDMDAAGDLTTQQITNIHDYLKGIHNIA